MAAVADSHSDSSCDILRRYWFEPDSQVASGMCFSACVDIMLQPSYITGKSGSLRKYSETYWPVGLTANQHHNPVCQSSPSCGYHLPVAIAVTLVSDSPQWGKNSIGTCRSQVPLVPLKVALESSIFFCPKAIHLPLVRNTWFVPKGQ